MGSPERLSSPGRNAGGATSGPWDGGEERGAVIRHGEQRLLIVRIIPHFLTCNTVMYKSAM